MSTSIDLNLPFAVFAFEALSEYAKEVPGGKLSRKMWMEQMDVIHKAWHAARDEKKARAKAFVPPAPAEVESYSISIGWPLDGASFCAGYEAKGWCISGRTKMRSYQATIRKWKAEGWTTKRHPAMPVNGHAMTEPAGWLDFMRANYADCVFIKTDLVPTWKGLRREDQKTVIELMEKGA